MLSDNKKSLILLYLIMEYLVCLITNPMITYANPPF